MPGRWVVVVPVKEATAGKTRLGGALDEPSRVALARAMALDTIEAAAGCSAVGLVVVVTADEMVGREAPTSRRRTAGSTGGAATRDAATKGAATRGAATRGTAMVRVVPEPSHTGQRSGLDAAAAAGVRAGRAMAPSAPVGVLLGDLPALRPDDLATALDDADRRDRAMVPDAAGTGTTLITVGPGAAFDSRFGVGSAAAHVALGYALLDVAGTSTLRHDVDLPVDLDTVRAMEPGPRTARLLDRLLAGGGRVVDLAVDRTA
ncbi:MAG TPA: 2-phospho-L-lactate guanylyltransferase [Cellulomonas sp.]